MEEAVAHEGKMASDSAYSISCNSQSQRSGSGCGSGSTKSRRSGSSGSSSGYCGQPAALTTGNKPFPQPKGNKRLGHAGSENKNQKKQKTSPESPVSGFLAEEPAAAAAAAASAATAAITSKQSDGAMTTGAEFRVEGGSDEALPSGRCVASLHAQAQIKEPSQGLANGPEFHLNASSQQTANPGRNVKPISSEVGTELNVQIPEVTDFCAIVSMEDGVVIHTSQNVERVLGFPQSTWLGQSFIDFVHAKDQQVFASNVASGVVTPLSADRGASGCLALKNIFFSRLRYRGLAASAAADCYLPFQLTTSLREVGKPSADRRGLVANSIFLVIAAKLVHSAFKYADEVRALPKFVTKHLASCEISHVDADAVPSLGYLPQDLIGRSVMDFYHPEDLPYLKEVYLTVLKEKEPIFRSKPYRFRVQNGGYVLLETEWSSFINPWTMKLEFVTGQHQPLQGPADPDVFHPPPTRTEIGVEGPLHVKEEIRALLRQTIRRATDVVRVHAENRCRNLASFMASLLDDISPHGLKTALFGDGDSVMLGEISPHHDLDSTSKSSTETPPSYTQLNFKENIQRFFESKPKTSLSETEAKSSLPSKDEDGKSQMQADSSLGSIHANNRKHSSPVNDSASGSGSRQSSGSNDKGDTSGDSRKHAFPGSYPRQQLTEALLYRHNEDMEKEMSKKHRENRGHWGKNDKEKRLMKKTAYKLFQKQCQGMKRSRSRSWDAEPRSFSKQRFEAPSPRLGAAAAMGDDAGHACVSRPSFPDCPRSAAAHLVLDTASMIPTESTSAGVNTGRDTVMPRIASVKPVGASDGTLIVNTSMSMLRPAPKQKAFSETRGLQRAPSQATSLKAEPGSAVGSVASVSFIRCTLSECSKKALVEHHVGLEATPLLLRGQQSSQGGSSFSSLSFTSDDSSASSSLHVSDCWGRDERETREIREDARPVLQEPPWLEKVNVTPELIFRYQIENKPIHQVLDLDLKKLDTIRQPGLVNEQLCQFYADLESEGLATQLMLDEGLTSSGASSGEEATFAAVQRHPLFKSQKKRRRSVERGKLTIVLEENAPIPSLV